jgi:phosphomannomutase
MVTGSHNAPAYNGFKLTAAKAKPVFGAEIIALGRLAAEARFVSGEGSSRTVDLRERYVHRLSRCLSEERAPPLRVAWDAGNGATGEVLARLVATLPGEHIVLNGAIDGGFPSHHPDPTVPANLRQLIDTVTARTLDLGIAFDGDGDRIGVVDGQGRIVWGDQLVALLARDLAVRTSDAPATVILDIKSSAASTFAIERGGARALLWKTGHSLIKAKMAETGAPLAGEMSGHIFFADEYLGFDDALYAAMRVLRLLARAGRSLATLLDSLPVMHSTPELRIECDDTQKFAIVGQVAARVKASGAHALDIDGVRVTTEDGWWLLRASNTQPALVARAEASTPEALARNVAALRGALEASGLAPPF